MGNVKLALSTANCTLLFKILYYDQYKRKNKVDEGKCYLSNRNETLN